MKRILKTILIISILLVFTTIALGLVFYRSDLSREELEPIYFTDSSHYMDVVIQDLEENDVEVDIHYQDNGTQNENTIVLLHGMFASLHTFEYWTNNLVIDGYRVVCIDLPNHGLSGNYSDNTVSTRRSAAVVKYILDELEISSCIIGGNSMGGGVSWYFASEYHNVDGFNVDGLLLIDAVYPAENNDNSGGKGLIRFMANSPANNILCRMTPKFLLKAILKKVYGSDSNIDEKTLDRYYSLLRKEGNRKAIINTKKEQEIGLSGEERLSTIKDNNIDTLVMWGEEDSWIDVEYAYSFQDILALDSDKVIVYTGLGHVPMEEKPEKTYQDFISFLEQQ